MSPGNQQWNTSRGKGGPANPLHHDQDELFYVIDGENGIEVGQAGRLLITFTPPGRMEAFFREVSKANAMPPPDPALWRAHGMELLGPPLPV